MPAKQMMSYAYAYISQPPPVDMQLRGLTKLPYRVGWNSPIELPSSSGIANVRFGSKADMCSAKGHVRFTPNSDRESGLPQKGMSALHPRADIGPARTATGRR